MTTPTLGTIVADLRELQQAIDDVTKDFPDGVTFARLISDLATARYELVVELRQVLTIAHGPVRGTIEHIIAQCEDAAETETGRAMTPNEILRANDPHADLHTVPLGDSA